MLRWVLMLGPHPPWALGRRYNFSWEPSGVASASVHAPIKCLTRQGIIGPGRQFEMAFEYTPQADTTAEAFWVRFTDPPRVSLFP